MADLDAPFPQSELILYQAEDGSTRVQVRLQDETVWLTQKLMADLFQASTYPYMSMHIRNVLAEGELEADSVVKEFFTTEFDGKRYATQHYNLDVIISVGYLVKSQRGVPHLGYAATAGVHREGIYDGRRTTEAVGRRWV